MTSLVADNITVNAVRALPKRKYAAIMLSVFGDESTDETKRRVFAVGGVIGRDDEWDQLESKWITRTGGIPFHAKDCDSDRGDYESTDHHDNKALYRDLAIMLAESGLGGKALAIDLIAERRAFPDAPDIAYYKGFIEVLAGMQAIGEHLNEVVKFTFDIRRESDHNAGYLYGVFREMPEWQRSTFSEISFVCSREHPRVQIADLFVREAMKALDNRIGPVKRQPRKSWMALYNTGHFIVDVLGEQWFEDLKIKMPALQLEAGMSREGYLDWLAENKLIHNTTNLFRYTEWTAKRDRFPKG